jgi:hypothetical protein
MKKTYKINKVIMVICLLLLGCTPNPKATLRSEKKLNDPIAGTSKIHKQQPLFPDTLSEGNLFGSASPINDNKPGWVEVSTARIFPNSMSPDEAKQKVFDLLRRKAIEKKVEARVDITTLLTDMMSESPTSFNEQTAWSGFFLTSISGVITAENIVTEKLIPLESKNSYEKQMTIRAYVVPVLGERDPSYYVESSLEDNMLNHGDELSIKIRPSKDSYVYVFNLMADHNAMLMFPNDYSSENYIMANKTLNIPDENIRDHVKLRVGTLSGQEITTESIYIICTIKPVQLPESLPKIGRSLSVFSGEGHDFTALQNWLMKIPLNQRVEKNLIYHISK